MKAVRITSYGGPEVLVVAEVNDPPVTANTVIARVAAAGVNFVDTHMRAGRSLHDAPLPAILGLEGAGVVEQVGDGIDTLAPGDRIAWSSVVGSYADKVAIPLDKAVAVPPSVDLDQAAAVLLQGITAHYLANDTAPLGPGTKCLVHAGAGGVSGLLIQMAKMKGAEVFTTVSTPEKAQAAIAAGADHVIDYSADGFGQRIEEIAGPRPLDVVFDAVGAPVFEASVSLLRIRGAMVCFGHSGGAIPPLAPLDLARYGSIWLTRTTSKDFVASPEEFRARATEVLGWLDDGRLRPRIGLRLPLEEAATAHRAIEARTTIGKTLLLP